MGDLFQTYLNQFLADLIKLIELAILAYGSVLVKKATDWIKSKTTVNQQNLLNSIAYNAVLFIEQRYKDLEGNGKFSEAVQHVVQVLAQKGFNIDIAAIQAAVQAAYEDAKKNGLITVIPTPTPNTNSTLVTRPEPIPQA